MKQLFKIGAITGLIGGGLFILFFLILSWSVDDPLGDDKAIEFFIIMVVYVGLYFLYRYQITFRQGFLIGNIANLIMVFLSVSFMYLLLNNKSNQILDKHIKQKISLVENSAKRKKNAKNTNKQVDKAKLAQFVTDLKSKSRGNWLNHIIQRELISKLLLGFVISLLLSVVFRKYRPKEPAPTPAK